MQYASSLAKSTYKGTKSAAKYMASYVIPSNSTISTDKSTDEPTVTDQKLQYSWVSCLIFFRMPHGNYILDQACILVGDIPAGYHGFFTNFTNWTVQGNRLYYTGDISDQNEPMVEIDPSNVHIHFKVGDSIFDRERFAENPANYLYYVSSPKSKMYKLISDQLTYEKVKIYDLSFEYGPISALSYKERTAKIQDPRFLTDKYQVYGKEMEHVMYSGINPPVL